MLHVVALETLSAKESEFNYLILITDEHISPYNEISSRKYLYSFVKWPSRLSDVNENSNSSTVFRKVLQYQISSTFSSNFLRTDRQTDGQRA